MPHSVLASAGDASGDRAVADVILSLKQLNLGSFETFGVGGDAMAASSAELLVHLRTITGMGFRDVLARLPRIVRARRRLLNVAKERAPRAALLFNYSEFNTQLLNPLAALGVKTLFYSPPQAWAWRPARFKEIAKRATRIAVTLPFEAELWRRAGADVFYAGHPAWTVAQTPQTQGQRARVAILPGSRRAEVRGTLLPCLEALATVRRSHGQAPALEAQLLLSPSLDAETRVFARTLANRFDVAVVKVDASLGLAQSLQLQGFSAALVASGTASLECALHGVPPVIVGPSMPGLQLAARLLLNTPHIGLPNIVLGRRAFPELLGSEVRANTIAAALLTLLEAPEGPRACCLALHAAMALASPAAQRVAESLAQWLA
jgi:lipid-A-disaccharide synthase